MMKKTARLSVLLASIVVCLVLLIFFSRYPRHDLYRHSFQEYTQHIQEKAALEDRWYSFAGTEVPFWVNDTITNRFEREYQNIVSNIPQLLLYTKRGILYFPYIKQILDESWVPEDFIYLSVIESDLYPIAISPAWAAWIWQFLPQTAREYWLQVDGYVDERLNFEKSTEAAAQYFLNAYDALGDWTLAAASFNRWVTWIKSLVTDQKETSYYLLTMNEQTWRYVFRATAVKYALKDFQKFVDIKNLTKEMNSQTKKVQVGSIEDIAAWSIENSYKLNDLKELNPWILTNQLPDWEWVLHLPIK